MRNRVGPNVQAAFDTLVKIVNQHRRPQLRVAIYEAPAHDFPKARDFAYCHTEPERGTWVIGTAPKMDKQPIERIVALLMHEIAHAELMDRGDYNHTECAADQTAERLFSAKIYYDSEDVQTVKPGQRPRPPYLPQ
jgi:hypothetical protein